MKNFKPIYSLLLLFCFFSCGNTNEDVNNNANEIEDLFDTKQASSIKKDSIVYYNGNQQAIDVNVGEKFGFIFEADQQDLLWNLASNMDQHILYLSEMYEPNFNSDNSLGNGLQLYTFSAISKGNSKLVFNSKNDKEKKSIQIHIK